MQIFLGRLLLLVKMSMQLAFWVVQEILDTNKAHGFVHIWNLKQSLKTWRRSWNVAYVGVIRVQFPKCLRFFLCVNLSLCMYHSIVKPLYNTPVLVTFLFVSHNFLVTIHLSKKTPFFILTITLCSTKYLQSFLCKYDYDGWNLRQILGFCKL
jgi:hypothetical protein